MQKTLILPNDQMSDKKYQGLLMLPKLQQFVLLDGKSFQQYMAEDKGFQKIMLLLYGGVEYEWMTVFFGYW